MEKGKTMVWGSASPSWVANLNTQYGLNRMKWEALWERQNRVCPGCLGELAHPQAREMKEGLEPKVDYVKELDRLGAPKTVRGLVCTACRARLRLLTGEDKEVMVRLGRYLKENTHG